MAACNLPPTVLVIDDERGPRESLRILLKNRYLVLCADSVAQGLRMVEERSPDAVVMDIRMPGKSGIEGLRDIRGVDPVVSVIMLTGFGTLESAQEAIRLGANDYLRKPFDACEMEAVIQRNVERTRLERRRWQAEQELAALNEHLVKELVQKEHLAALGQKTAELVHDLRNPLTVVLGNVELLSGELRNVSEQLGPHWQEASEYLDMIEKGVMRCKELADMWLSLGRGDPQRIKPFVLQSVIAEVVKGLVGLAGTRGAAIEFTPGEPDAEVAADKLQIIRALHNVIVNAIDAMSGDPGVVRVVCRRCGSMAEVTVQDNGCGMTSEQLAHAFDPYYTTKGRMGTGLGLFITRRVIEEHHGTVELRSRPHEGTCVTIRLPLVERPEVAVA